MPSTIRGHSVAPTEEQRRARDAFVAGGDLAVVAGAGTGKTSALMLMAAATRRRGLYLAFNRATADDARHRFGPNVECRTAAFAGLRGGGRTYRDRLNSSARIPSAQTARILGTTRDLRVGGARARHRLPSPPLAGLAARRFGRGGSCGHRRQRIASGAPSRAARGHPQLRVLGSDCSRALTCRNRFA